MFQQQKQQDNKLQKKTEEILATSFVMPAIRTMADDLAEANNPTPISVPISVPIPTTKVTDTSSGSEKASFDRSFNKVVPPTPPQKLVVNPVVNVSNVIKANKPPEPRRNIVLVPDQKTTGSSKSVGISIFFGALVSLVLCAAVWATWMYWPRKNATIADKIPSETLAFISFHRGAGASEKILPKILEQLKVSELNSPGSQWSDLVYGILPGNTSYETIPFLLLTNGGNLDLSGTEMTSKKLANGTTIIVDNAAVGRLSGLNGKSLGENSEYKHLASKAPKSAEYLYMNQGQLTSVIKAFTYLSSSTDYPVLVSLSSGGQNMLAISGVKGTESEWTKKQITWDKLLKPVPAEILSATGGTDISKIFDDWRIAQSNDPKMQEFLNGLNDQGKVLEKIRADLTGAYIAGSIFPTNLLPDGINVMEIKDGATDDLKAQMSLVEIALTKLGRMIGGASYSDATFTDTNYKDVLIRFVNFGDSNHSFDYAIVDSMLFVSNSKNSMQKMIDTYKGEADSFANVVHAKGQIQDNWRYILFSPDTLTKLSPSLKTFFSGFTSLYIEPTGTNTFNGSIAF